MRCLLLVALAACGDAAAPAADAVDHARTDLVPAVGTADTLDIACWNLRMFPSSPTAITITSDLVASLQLDIVAVEEVESRAALEQLVARLPGWDVAMPTPEGSATGGIAVLWNTAVVTSTSVDALADARLIRPVVRAVFDVGGTSLALHAVHLKAGTAASDESARIAAAAAVESQLTDERTLVLGDFNEDFDDPRATEVFAPFTADRYTVISKPVDDAGGVTFLPANIMLDQMVATVSLGATAPLIPALATQLPTYRTEVSDHLPLVVRLAL